MVAHEYLRPNRAAVWATRASTSAGTLCEDDDGKHPPLPACILAGDSIVLCEMRRLPAAPVGAAGSGSYRITERHTQLHSPVNDAPKSMLSCVFVSGVYRMSAVVVMGNLMTA